MASEPQYIITPITGGAQLATGDTSRTAPAEYEEIFAPGANGGFCERISVIPTGDTVAGVVRIFKKNGANFYPLFDVQVKTRTYTNSTQVDANYYDSADMSRPDIMPIGLPPNWTLVASVSVNNPIFVTAEGGAY